MMDLWQIVGAPQFGVLATLLVYLIQSIEGRRVRKEDIERLTNDAAALRHFIESCLSRSATELQAAYNAHHTSVIECLTELVPSIEGAFNTVLQEINTTSQTVLQKLESLSVPYLAFTAHDWIRMPTTSPGINCETSPSFLLDAKSEVVPFFGRREEISEIVEIWCASNAPLAVRLYEAPGGMGKTRLFIQICRILREAGWLAGFLHRRVDDLPGRELSFVLGSPVPKFIVVDYAQEHTERLCRLLRELADMVDHAGKVRVVLLVREAGDWWPELQSKPEGVGNLLAGIPPIRLRPLAEAGDVNSRRAVFEGAARAFRSRLPGAVAPATEASLTATGFERVLLIHLAAYAAVQGHSLSDEAALLSYVAGRERTRLATTANDRGVHAPQTVWQAAALVALLGGADRRDDILGFVGRLPRVSRAGGALRDVIVDILRELYPSDEEGSGYVRPMEPDLLGEAFIAMLSPSDLEDVGAAAFCDEAAPWRQTVILRLSRASLLASPVRVFLLKVLQDRFGELSSSALAIAQEEPEPLAGVLTECVSRGVDATLLARLSDDLPDQTVALSAFAVAVSEAALALAKNGGDVSATATALNNLANRLSEVGRRDESLEPAQEAVRIYGELAAKNPDAYRPALAGSLNNLANLLSEVGRRDEALEPAQEAVRIYGELAAKNPDAYRPALAMSLNNLANRLSEVGRRDESLEPAQEAVRIRRELAAKNPDAYRPALAMSLGAQGRVLSGLGRAGEAHASFEQGALVLFPLFERLPEAHAQLLAMLVQDVIASAKTAACEPSPELQNVVRSLERWSKDREAGSSREDGGRGQQ